MTEPFYTDDWLTLYGGDCLDVMRGMPADSVDCVVTSPPYWGLRDYGTATWDGGDAECDHMQKVGGTASSTLGEASGGHAISDEARVRSTTRSFVPYSHSCGKCGATRIDSQLGLERTPEEYVANMVAVFREVRRVLKPSGTCWLNLGDSYASSGGERAYGSSDNGTGRGNGTRRHDVPATGLKPKDLVGIPWRVAFALQADGWYLRSDIIWSKPNPMPESVTDRPTKAHEYLFLLTKSARYFFDADAVREPWRDDGRNGQPGAPSPKALRIPGQTPHTLGAKQWTSDHLTGRNIRSVWTIATRPYPGAHFAVFPPELPERCIKAGSLANGVVLDPFGGSGTVGMVANRLSRRAILIDLNPEYLKQQMKRNAQVPLGM
jgi:DNA modification methylase